MNYRHAFHAGNFADVAKHLMLTAILLYLRRKEASFVVIDTHAGRGLYDLEGEEARRTGEAESGIALVRDVENGSPLLSAYLHIVRSSGPAAYPGSPLLAAKLLRPQDRLVALEKHPEEAATLASVLRPFPRARAESGDGYASLAALLPPPERRGAILIDPPYEAEDEFAQAAESFGTAFRRFATGIYMIWFPIKSTAAADAFCGEVLAVGVQKALRADIMFAAPSRERLTAAGLLIVNPPYRIAEDAREALAPVLPRLKAEMRFQRLAGD
jgi:23S rRNA (adenine2030-N6)-methyltransferase